MPTATLLAEIANFALTLSLFVAIVFGAAQLSVLKKDRRERLTLENLRNFQSREFAEIILFTTTTTFPDTYDEWLQWPEEGRIKFIQLMQQMESLGILLADKLIDIDLLDKTLGSYIYTSWERYKPITLEIRERSKDPYLAEYFQWMAEKIERRMRERPRKPAFER